MHFSPARRLLFHVAKATTEMKRSGIEVRVRNATEGRAWSGTEVRVRNATEGRARSGIKVRGAQCDRLFLPPDR